jgi:leucyl-tRNA synthetase
MSYDFKKIEKKWNDNWEKQNLYYSKIDKKRKKFYCLEMFPYPSGKGLHIGHALNYVIGDIYSRFKKMLGFNVFHPMGYDAFGLPAENAAISVGEHPEKYTINSINQFIKQQKSLGLSYDWSKILITCNEDYYKWNQFFFLKFLEKGLIYRKKAPVNWCPKCNTVLANEQVKNGKCWRHENTGVEIKYLEQWFIKITDYANELLEFIDDLQWPERIKIMQKNWIGKSNGTEIDFEINGKKFPVFTTRPDTIYGVTFMVISAQHQNLMEFVSPEKEKEVNNFLKKIRSVSEKEQNEFNKEGIFIGNYAINPITKEKIPIYAGNFVVADYGSGMVMAVPAHDLRDFDFAKKYDIPIKFVIESDNFNGDYKNIIKPFTSFGKLINSENFNGLDSSKAKKEITNFLIKNKIGRNSTQFKLKDWLISRQRYWGTPIPIIYCDKCGIVPVPEKDLPVKLPTKVKFGKGNPLETAKNWINVKCPKCGSPALRETDTMDTFFDSSWYFLRFLDNKNLEKPFDIKKVDYWMPVDKYIGGAEHACMHLIYARFFTKILRDLGFINKNFKEPFKSLFNQGMLHSPDGRKMSKSLGNVINPLEIIKKYGADSLRLSLVSFASPDKDTNWSDKILIGNYKFLLKLYDKFNKIKITSRDNLLLEHKLNKSIKLITHYIENLKYNLAIIKLRELFEEIPEEIPKKVFDNFLKLLHPFCPYITEELWKKFYKNKSIYLSKWPEVDESKINENFEKSEIFTKKLIEDINCILKIRENKKEKKVSKVFVYVLPKEKEYYLNNLKIIRNKTNLDVEIFSVTDSEIKSGEKDPENKSKKAKPGKPGIYFKCS